MPSFLVDSRLNTADDAVFAGKMVPGAPMDDAPIESVGSEPWLLQMLGDRFQLLHYVADAADLDAASVAASRSRKGRFRWSRSWSRRAAGRQPACVR